MEKITADDVMELANMHGYNPTMIRWDDTNEIEVIRYIAFNDISYEDRFRAHTIIATHDCIEAIADRLIDDMTGDDYIGIAECLNFTS